VKPKINAQFFIYQVTQFDKYSDAFRRSLSPFLGMPSPVPTFQHVIWPQYICLTQSFWTAEPRPGTGPRHQLYRAARGFPGICHFSFL